MPLQGLGQRRKGKPMIEQLFRFIRHRSVIILLLMGVSLTLLGAGAYSFITSPDTLQITVIQRSEQGASETTVFSKTIHDAVVAQAVYQQITSLHTVGASETYHCPAGSYVYYHYQLEFQHQGIAVIEASSDASACQFWKVEDFHISTSVHCCPSDTFWEQLSQATGAPKPIFRTR